MWLRWSYIAFMASLVSGALSAAEEPDGVRVEKVLDRVRNHEFHPIRDGFTYDRVLDEHGTADMHDDDWLVRTLAVRDLVLCGDEAIPELIRRLGDSSSHVRQVSAMVLGILGAEDAVNRLEEVLAHDEDDVVRSQAAIALGQIGRESAVSALRRAGESDDSRDVRHQASIAAYRIEQGVAPSAELAQAYAGLDEQTFGQVRVGEPAIDFELRDTDGVQWRLSDFRGDKTVVLIWIFADWCPVCHKEFRDLIELRDRFVENDIQVFTIECHDSFRSRVMAGQEVHPEYWFSQDASPQALYAEERWWPHLVDAACTVGAQYGVDPMQFVVHAEWINRPATVIVDREGIVRLAYVGTFWGDRPSIGETLDMILSGDYAFEHPRRLKTN